ncbi:hypothetical protein J1N35_025452 [Gossypium stocksii]|uniref:Uncharacterized protein n=1 Tax=Gossypium stocksii TaxID=47602 RepID=A0A9D3V6K1_9ROSI|nr:hypothetical protein J1N35_025452 [Gossypium stocksii]
MTIIRLPCLTTRGLKWQNYPNLGGRLKMQSSTQWIRLSVQASLKENEAAIKKFEQA